MNSSAILIVYVAVLAIATQEACGAMTMDQLKQATGMLRKVCQPKTGVATEVIDAVKKGIFTDDRKLKCYMKCVMEMVQGMSRDGKLQPDAAIAQAKKLLPVEIRDGAIAVIEKCRTVQQENDGVDGCEMAFLATKCGYEADKEIFLFP